GDTIEVIVGEAQSVFHVHEELVCAHSDFFKTAIKPEWAESYPKVIHLPEDDPVAFLCYMQWLYCKQLPTSKDDECRQLARAYALGEKLLDIDFKNDVIDAMVAKASIFVDGIMKFPGSDAIEVLYYGTPESSPARRLFIEFWTFVGKEEWMTDQPPPYEFLIDLSKSLLRQRPRPHGDRPWIGFPELYHVKTDKQITEGKP
ncbi:hypothetical protein AOQ84DRAFT_293161, partial [Glonium stellatum]